MSHEINCPECNFANTPGSKFCNNCGTKLPLSTHILCPNCSTSNTRDRIFCDNCGSRLVPGQTPKPEEPEVQEPASGSDIFALPTRKPGETGELDPSKLPDWLSHQMAEQTQSEDVESEEEIPHIEEFQSDKRQTDDLPDWLVHDSDPEPIINAPTTISTEFFLDLVEAEDFPDLDSLDPDQDDELMQGAQDANLPDWLSEANSITDLATPGPPPKESLPKPEEIFSDIPDESLFQDLSEDSQEDEPDWLTNEVAADEQDDSGVTEWLSDLEEITAVPTTTEADEDIDEGSGLTEWLSDLDSDESDTDEDDAGDVSVDLFAEDDFTETTSDEDDDDWLNNFSEPDPETAVSPAKSSSYTESFPDPDEGDGDSWWDDFTDEVEDEEEDDPAEPAITDEPAMMETIPDSDDDDSWWDDFSDEADEETPTENIVESPIQETIPESDEDDEWWDDFTDDEATEDPSNIFALDDADGLDDLEGFLAEGDDEEEGADETAVPEWATVTDEHFDTLFEESESREEDLPDWLSAAGNATGPLMSDHTPEDTGEFLANTQSLVDKAETDWLADLDGIASETPELSDDFLGLDESEDLFMDELAAPVAEDEEESEPDWLSDLSQVDTGQLLMEAEADLANLPEETLPETPPEETASEQTISEPVMEDDDWDAQDDDFFNMEEGDSLPDWMSQLADPSGQSAEMPPPLSTDEELPDWIASMRPEENSIASELGGSLSAVEPELPDSLEGLPFDLVGGDLPDWLTNDTGTNASRPAAQQLGAPSIDENPEIPDWLKADGDDSDSGDSDDNWVSMLDELPAAVPLASTLARADIPEWVEELRPAELDENKAGKPTMPAGPEEMEGPLAGLRGVVAIETAITQPHSIEPVQQFLVTPEQQNQIALLHQILHEESGTGTIVGTKAQAHVSAALRIVLSILLVGAIVLGLRGITVVKSSFSTAPASVVDVNTAVTAAANNPVLVAFEYTPAMQGELTPQAETLLAQLKEQNSDIVIVSQYPSATTIAETVIAETFITGTLETSDQIANLGYLPGNAIGLRQLSDCLSGESACQTLVGHTVPASTRQKLQNVSLIIVLTGNKDSLTNWIEQVGANDNIAISAGITTALVPSASPYYATGQLNGYLGGILDTAVYQDLIEETSDNVWQLLNAQVLGQLLVATLLLLALIIYGVSSSLSKRSKNKRS